MTNTAARTADEFLATLPGRRHDKARVCPRCGDDLSRQALVNLAYVFTECDCGIVDFPHLYEQLWHTEHLRTA